MHPILVGCEIVGHQVVIKDGSYTKEKFWLRGHCAFPAGTRYKFIDGHQGKETEVTLETIKPAVQLSIELDQYDARILERRNAA